MGAHGPECCCAQGQSRVKDGVGGNHRPFLPPQPKQAAACPHRRQGKPPPHSHSELQCGVMAPLPAPQELQGQGTVVRARAGVQSQAPGQREQQ